MVKKFVPDLLHKELSYQIHGAAIEVRKDFGPGHKEKLYQTAFAAELIYTNIRPMYAKILLASISLILAFFGGVSVASAAQLNLTSSIEKISVGQQFQVELFLNTEGDSINAVEGEIILPDFIKINDLQDGNTIISLWVQKPKLANHNQIIFSGIIPSGYNGSLGKIFSILFQAEKKGQGVIQIINNKTLLNDGKGTEAKLTTGHLSLAVISDDISVPSRVMVIPDTERPESFMPEIAKDATLLDGKWFVVFATQDKASGIDHYEIKESRQIIFSMFKKWTSSESPHVLRDQELRSFVFVKAVDKAGNKRIIKIAPRNPLPWYKNYENWIIIIIAALIIIGLILKLKRRY